MSLEDITNFMQISEKIASSGQPEDHQFRNIAEAGYRHVINLAMPNSENAIPEEGNIVTALQMTYTHIPVPFDAPSQTHLQTFTKIMSCFSDEKVFVHCVLNYRVSAFLYRYFCTTLGYTDKNAKMVILPGWQPNETWQRFMTS